VQLFEDPKVEKEVDIRKRILRDFNKKEEDFANLSDYNDYLEMVEELIYNLMHNIDIINTNKRIEQYKKENKDIILKNKQKISREEYELEQIIEIEREQAEQREKEIMMIEIENRKNKNKNKEELIDSLMGSYEDANKIVEKFAQKAEEEQKVVLPKPVRKETVQSYVSFKRRSTIFVVDRGIAADPILNRHKVRHQWAVGISSGA
jgi:CDK-activating kinase assembly factor MAT1